MRQCGGDTRAGAKFSTRLHHIRGGAARRARRAGEETRSRLLPLNTDKDDRHRRALSLSPSHYFFRQHFSHTSIYNNDKNTHTHLVPAILSIF